MVTAQQPAQRDARFMKSDERESYVDEALGRARKIAGTRPDGNILIEAYEPMLRYVLQLRNPPYWGACHSTSAVVYMRLRQLGILEADLNLCIGEAEFPKPYCRFDHSWVELRDQVFDVAICAPNLEEGRFAGGPVFAGVDLSTDAPALAQFGIESDSDLEDEAKDVLDRSLQEYLRLQHQKNLQTLAELANEVYGIDGMQLLIEYGNIRRVWRNPLRNPPVPNL